MTLDEAHDEIATQYRWFADQNPVVDLGPHQNPRYVGVKVVTHGRIKQLWDYIDAHTDPVTGDEW